MSKRSKAKDGGGTVLPMLPRKKPSSVYDGLPAPFAEQGRRQAAAVAAGFQKAKSKRAVDAMLDEIVGGPIAALMHDVNRQAMRANGVEALLVAVVEAVGHWPMSKPDVAAMAGTYLQIKQRVDARQKRAEDATKAAKVASANTNDNGASA